MNCFVRFGDVWFVSALKAEICVACKEFTNTNTPFRLGKREEIFYTQGKHSTEKTCSCLLWGCAGHTPLESGHARVSALRYCKATALWLGDACGTSSVDVSSFVHRMLAT